MNDNFLNSANAPYVAELFFKYREDPNLVDQSWRSFFNSLNEDDISVFDEKSEDNAKETNNNNDLAPQLFSDEDIFNNSSESNDQQISKNEDEEDFQIPAFLRNQKF